MKKTKEPLAGALVSETRERGNAKDLSERLARYHEVKLKALEIAEYLTTNPAVKAFPGLIGRIETCGSLLQFRNYYTIDETKLHRANFCKTHLLCPFCAMRRGAKYARAYNDRINLIRAYDKTLKLYLVSFTVKNGPSLEERFRHCETSITKMLEQRRNAIKELRSDIELSKALGGVFSFEVKRGEGSKEWHPHIHSLMLCREPMNVEQLSKEWLAISGDSHIVHIRECDDDQDSAGLEVFAYALKFSTMEKEDLFYAFKLLRGKRFIRSFGILRGVVEPEDLNDEEYEDLPYYDMIYRYIFGEGYKLKGMEVTLKGESDGSRL